MKPFLGGGVVRRLQSEPGRNSLFVCKYWPNENDCDSGLFIEPQNHCCARLWVNSVMLKVCKITGGLQAE